AKVTRRFGDFAVSASRTVSDENDYNSRAFGLGAEWSLNQRNTTLAAGYGKSNDRVGSRDDPTLHERRDTKEYLLGVTQVLSPLDIVQSTITRAHTLEAAWEQSFGERWSVRPALRYYTQSAADFYSPVSPASLPPAILSSD